MLAVYRSFQSNTKDLMLVLCMVGVLLILFTPLPAAALDFLLLVNFCLALLILLITFYTDKPTAFSTFPSLLLMTTLFRLALNISATRLILNDAEAGKVIGSVGEHVVGGNYIIGLIVFLILIVVQYIVVTSGAQRVAEVAARFILDSLPGKQMSIDADLNMGIIDQDQAQKRRAQLEKESNFYGAMDGASKFVKGDAIAGIIIILIDIIGGLIIGIAQRGMDWNDALHQYTLLTVGDGIVTQIPSLIVATATGIIITRAATDARLAEEITNQFAAHPKTLLIASFALMALMLVPGMPVLPLLAIVVALFFAAWLSHRKAKKSGADDTKDEDDVAALDSDSDENDILNLTKVQPFELALGKELADHYLSATGSLEKRIGILRKQVAGQFGIILPPLSVKAEKNNAARAYSVQIHGVEAGKGEIKPEALLAINPGGNRVEIEGEKTVEPTYGLPALWISSDSRSQAHAAGYTLVDAETVLVTHIQELCRRNAAEFLTRTATERLIESRRDDFASLIDELVPAILSYSDIQRVMQALVSELVPIKNLETILEVLVDSGRQIKDPDQLAEKVREKLSSVICEGLNNADGQLSVITLAPGIERKIVSSTRSADSAGVSLTPFEMEQFVKRAAKECESMLSKNLNPVLLCTPIIRKTLRHMLLRTCPQLSVLSTQEVSRHPHIVSAGVIDVDVASK